MMETQLGRQCNEVRRARPLQRLLRGILKIFEGRGSGRGLIRLSIARAPAHSGYRPAADEPMGAPEPEVRPTQAELEALRWTMDGMTDREIAQKLGLSEHEVALRVQRVMQKFRCGTRYEAGLRAIKLRLIEGL
jgi:DNA-binding CsgD family transcriptional regulator